MAKPANFERLPIIQHGDFLIDPQCRIATLAGQELHLFPKEFDLLCLLAQYPNWVLTVSQLYEHVWEEELIDCEHVVRNTICQLRRKLGRPEMIQTVVGHGYKLVVT